jgi:hypothetical protein
MGDGGAQLFEVRPAPYLRRPEPLLPGLLRHLARDQGHQQGEPERQIRPRPGELAVVEHLIGGHPGRHRARSDGDRQSRASHMGPHP